VTGALGVEIPARSLLAHPPAVVADFKTGVPCGNDPLFGGGLGVAVDIGTTTAALLLVELPGGGILSRASGLNAQVGMGDNVLTRIQLCQDDKSAVARLRDAFWKSTFDPLLDRALAEAGRGRAEISGVVLAGNTTMLHLACGEDPTPMGTVPFTPVFLDHRVMPGDRFGLPAGCGVHVLPGLSAYVGADIAAGAICRGIAFAYRPQLFVDVGTNGEILLAGPAGLTACATAAGPAFEGCGLLSGMRAAEGAISRIAFREGPSPVTWQAIGPPGGPLHGITGSAYIDFLSEARAAGLLTETGRFDREYVDAHPGRFAPGENGLCLLIDAVRIGEVDVALLLQAKAAIAAGIETLLERQGLQPSDIETLHLAGGFGLHLDSTHAIRCGLLPGFDARQIEAVGNTSLGGAWLAMMDASLVGEMEALRQSTDTIELNQDPGFEDRFITHLALP